MNMRSAALRHLVLPLALLVFTAKIHALGICDWDQRTFTKETDQARFRTVIKWYYSGGYIGQNEFEYNRTRLGCFIGTKQFSCSNSHAGDVMLTDLIVPWLKNVDSIYIQSSYPMTIHRIEDYVQHKTEKDRFIVEKGMRLSRCPPYKQEKLVWKFPGTVESRAAFKCFQEDTVLCTGVTTRNETGKCVVETEGNNLIHTQVVKASKMGVEFFYCYLDPATPRLALTYNVDWRNSIEKTAEEIPTEEVIDVGKPKDNTTGSSSSVTSLPESVENSTEEIPNEEVVEMTKPKGNTTASSSSVAPLPDTIPYNEDINLTKPNEDTNDSSSLIDILSDSVKIPTEGMPTEDVINETKPNDDATITSSSVTPLQDYVEYSTEEIRNEKLIDATKPKDNTTASSSLVAPLPDSVENVTEEIPKEKLIDVTKPKNNTTASSSLVAPLPDYVEYSTEEIPNEKLIDATKPKDNTTASSSLVAPLPDYVENSTEEIPNEKLVDGTKPKVNTTASSSSVAPLPGSKGWSLRGMPKFNMGLYFANTAAKDLVSMHLGTVLVVFATLAGHF